MKKILMDGDSIDLDGVEITKENLKKDLTELVVLRKQIKYVEKTMGGVIDG